MPGKNVSKKSSKKVCNKFSLNKTQLNNSSLIDLGCYFSTDLNWEMFYNIDNTQYDIKKIASKKINKNKIIQYYRDDNYSDNYSDNGKSNNISLEEQEEIQTIKNHFINLEILTRQKFLKFKTK